MPHGRREQDQSTGQYISDPFFMTMLGYLADALTERGHDLLLSRVIPKDPDWLNPVVDSGRVNGVILIGPSDQIDVIEKVASRYLPLVAWGANLPDTIHCSVGSDNRKGGEIATRLEGCRMARSAANLADKLSILPQALATLSICYSVGLRTKKPTLLCWNPNWSFANRVNVRAC